jgi:hypothetical protein
VGHFRIKNMIRKGQNMRLYLLTESHQEVLLEEAFRTNNINEGVLSLLDNAVEIAGSAAGFVPLVGDALGDIPLTVKNLAQGDYLGAALFLIAAIPEPTDITDAVAKTLRVIQKLAASTGQEKRINEYIKWILEKIPGGNIITFVNEMWEQAKAFIMGADADELKSKAKDKEEEKSAGIVGKALDYIKPHFNKMDKQLQDFLKLVQSKVGEVADVNAGMDIPDGFSENVAEKIKETYHGLCDVDMDKAIEYKRKILANARSKPDIMKAYVIVFGNPPVEIK